MGWYCSFKLEVEPMGDVTLSDKEKLELVREATSVKEVEKILNGKKTFDAKVIIKDFKSQNEYADTAFTDTGKSRTSVSWGDYSKDLLNFSLRHPNVFFTMTVEDAEDDGFNPPEKVYVFNGNGHTDYAKLVFPEFDKKAFAKKYQK